MEIHAIYEQNQYGNHDLTLAINRTMQKNTVEFFHAQVQQALDELYCTGSWAHITN